VNQDEREFLQQVWSKLRAERFPEAPENVDKIDPVIAGTLGETKTSHLGAIMGDPIWAAAPIWHMVFFILTVLTSRVYPPKFTERDEKHIVAVVHREFQGVLNLFLTENPKVRDKVTNDIASRLEDEVIDAIKQRLINRSYRSQN